MPDISYLFVMSGSRTLNGDDDQFMFYLTGSVTPLYKTYSPLELLDRHVAKSLAVHENKLSNSPAASQSKCKFFNIIC